MKRTDGPTLRKDIRETLFPTALNSEEEGEEEEEEEARFSFVKARTRKRERAPGPPGHRLLRLRVSASRLGHVCLAPSPSSLGAALSRVF